MSVVKLADKLLVIWFCSPLAGMIFFEVNIPDYKRITTLTSSVMTARLGRLVVKVSVLLFSLGEHHKALLAASEEYGCV